MIVQSASSRCQWIQALFSNRVVVSYICHGDCILLVHGCIIYAMEEEARGRGKIDLVLCREPKLTSEAKVKQMKKLVDVNNADAFQQLAEYYANGIRGMPQDYEKANELYLRGAQLGCTEAYCNSGALQ